jgi:hypothetical protein
MSRTEGARRAEAAGDDDTDEARAQAEAAQSAAAAPADDDDDDFMRPAPQQPVDDRIRQRDPSPPRWGAEVQRMILASALFGDLSRRSSALLAQIKPELFGALGSDRANAGTDTVTE